MSKNSDLIFKGQQHKLTAPFHEVRAGGRLHQGTDYGTSGKAAIQYCPLEGGVVYKVVTTEQNGNPRGLYADIRWKEHDIGTILQHAAKVLVRANQAVNAGDQIVTAGMTGKDSSGKRVSTGVHAHVELYRPSTGERMDFEKFDLEGLEMSYEKWKEYQARYEKEEAVKGVQEPARDSWGRMIKKGIVDGTAPRKAVTREVLAIMLDRLGMLK